MDKQSKQKARRILAAALAFTVTAGALPYTPLSGVVGDTAITANAEEEWSKTSTNTDLGTSLIEHPQAPENGVRWRGNYVYYGKYNGNPVKYRVLDADSQEFVPKDDNGNPKDPTQKTLFLESDSFVGSDWNYGEKKYSWNESVLKKYLTNVFYNKEGVFTPIEKSSIFSSTKSSKSTGEKADGVGYDDSSSQAKIWFETLGNDKVFVLDAKEATNPYYGYANQRQAHASKDRDGGYWLRSLDMQWKAMVEDGGAIVARSIMYANACPAFNVDLKKVILSSRISGNASDTYGKEYKLTLKDDKFGIGVTNGKLVTYDSSTLTVTIPYTVTDNDNDMDPDTVSVLITDQGGNIIY